MHELLAAGNLDAADEVLAPDYVNVAMGGADGTANKPGRDEVIGKLAR